MRKKQNINNTCTLLLLMGGLSLIILDLINRKSVNFQETFQFTVGKCQHFEMFRCSPEKTQRLAGWEALCTTVDSIAAISKRISSLSQKSRCYASGGRTLNDLLWS